MRTLCFSAAVAAVAGVLFAIPASSAATFKGRNGLIAYSHGGGEENFVLRTVKADGTENRRLIGPTGRRGPYKRGASGPHWSSNGKALLFGGHSHYDENATSLWYSTAAGRQITRIPLGLGRVELFGWAWAPDGRHVVFAARPARRRHATSRIYTIAVDGRQRKALTRGDRPSWSTDGRYIVFHRGYFSVGGNVPEHGVFIMRSNGHRLRRLTQAPEDAEPSFSPDGRQVAFVRSFGPPLPITEQRAEWHIIDVSGRHDQLVVTHYPGASRFAYCAPQWTPDGERLAAVRTEESGINRSIAALVTTSPTGADERVAFHVHPPVRPPREHVRLLMASAIARARMNSRLGARSAVCRRFERRGWAVQGVAARLGGSG